SKPGGCAQCEPGPSSKRPFRFSAARIICAVGSSRQLLQKYVAMPERRNASRYVYGPTSSQKGVFVYDDTLSRNGMPYQSGAIGVLPACSATAARSRLPSLSSSNGRLMRSSLSGSSGRVLNCAVTPPLRTNANLSRSVAPANIARSAGGAVVATCTVVPPRYEQPYMPTLPFDHGCSASH